MAIWGKQGEKREKEEREHGPHKEVRKEIEDQKKLSHRSNFGDTKMRSDHGIRFSSTHLTK